MTHRHYKKGYFRPIFLWGTNCRESVEFSKMEFQERAIHRPDLVFLDEMMLELDELEQENDLIEQENWEDMGLVFSTVGKVHSKFLMISEN